LAKRIEDWKKKREDINKKTRKKRYRYMANNLFFLNMYRIDKSPSACLEKKKDIPYMGENKQKACRFLTPCTERMIYTENRMSSNYYFKVTTASPGSEK